MEEKDKLPTDINSIPEGDRELFEAEGQETQKPEPKAEEVKPTPEKVEEEPKSADDEKETLKTEPRQWGVPVNKANQWRKEAAEAKKEVDELKKQIETIKASNASPIQKAVDVSEHLNQWKEKYGLSDEQAEPYKELVNGILSPLAEKLKIVEDFQAQKEEQQKEKEWNEYFQSEFKKITTTIEAEHKNISPDELAVMRERLKTKIINENLFQVPIEYIYKGSEDFRPSVKRKGIEPSGGNQVTKGKTIDFSNEKEVSEALKNGDIDIDEVDKVMMKNSGYRFR